MNKALILLAIGLFVVLAEEENPYTCNYQQLANKGMKACSNCESFEKLQDAEDKCCISDNCKAVAYTRNAAGKWVYQIREDSEFFITEAYIKGEVVYFRKSRRYYAEKIVIEKEDESSLEERRKRYNINYTGRVFSGVTGWFDGKVTKCGFDEVGDSRLGHCEEGCKIFKTLEDALRSCCSIPACYGVTYSNENSLRWGYQIRFSKVLMKRVGEQSYFRGRTKGLKTSSSVKTRKEIEEWEEEWDWEDSYKDPKYISQTIVDEEEEEFDWSGDTQTTTETKTKIKYTGRKWTDIHGWFNGGSTSCSYNEVSETSLGKKCSGECEIFDTLEKALESCCSKPGCSGVTYSNVDAKAWGWQTRFVKAYSISKIGEISYFRSKASGLGLKGRSGSSSHSSSNTQTITTTKELKPSGLTKTSDVEQNGVSFSCKFVEFKGASQDKQIAKGFGTLTEALDECCINYKNCKGVQLQDGQISHRGDVQLHFSDEDDVVYFLAKANRNKESVITNRVSFIEQQQNLKKQF